MKQFAILSVFDRVDGALQDMKFILGTKKNITETFEDDGTCHCVTVVVVPDAYVTQVKTVESDGYTAIQFGSGLTKENKLSKPLRGHLKDLGMFKYIKEIRLDGKESAIFKRGDRIDVSLFKVGDLVDIRAISKGKGFQGVVKRHGFSGGSRTHGQKHSEREPGAIGGGGRAGGRVRKGLRMAGRMGGETVSVRNLKVVDVDEKNHEISIIGAIPGNRGSLVEIRAK